MPPDSKHHGRLALNQQDAAASLSLSVNAFKQHVRPHLRAVYIGGATRYSVAELQRWLDDEVSRRSSG